MKKKVIIPVIAMLILISLAALFYFTPKTFGKNVNPSDVNHIEVFDGNTGVGFTIDNPEDIKYIIENIQSHQMKKDGISFFKTIKGQLLLSNTNNLFTPKAKSTAAIKAIILAYRPSLPLNKVL